MNKSDERKLFKGKAEYYARYRAKYPQDFFDYIKDIFKLDGTGKLLDLGCGTGQIAIPFSNQFEKVVGIDFEQDMIGQAIKEGKINEVSNIEWLCKRAEDIDDLGTFKIITIGKAFHWMEQKTVLKKAYDVLEKGGGLIVIGSQATVGEDGWRIYNDEWKEIRKKVIKNYLGEKRLAGETYFKEPKIRFYEQILESPFGNCEKWIHTRVRELSLDEIISETYSTSLVSKKLLGDNLSNFENDLRMTLLEYSPSGKFIDNIVLEALIATK